jgi:acetolactate synthase I/III small subunit
MTTTARRQHTLEVLVENSPGVLARVAGLFSRRAFNIDSLNVGPTENPAISKMIIVVGVEGHSLEQVIAQLDKLISVISIKEILTGNSEVIHDTQPDYQN